MESVQYDGNALRDRVNEAMKRTAQHYEYRAERVQSYFEIADKLNELAADGWEPFMIEKEAGAMFRFLIIFRREALA